VARRKNDPRKNVPDLDITTFLNLMVVLIPFLLLSAVFSQITVLQLNLPGAGAAGNPNKKTFEVEVVVRKDRL
jgi:biopolymer transport protein ExbD